MADVNLDGIITWLKSWFYDKTEMDTLLNGKSNTNHNHNIWNLNQNNSSTGAYALEDWEDNDHMAVFGNLIYSANDDALYYKDPTDSNNEIATLGDTSGGGGGSVTVDSALSTTSTNPVQNKIITNALNGKSNDGHTHTISNITDYPTIETQTITVTSPTSGSNYFSGGTREITAWKWGKLVTVTVNFYNVGAKASSTSTDTTIGTLPSGWHPNATIYARPNTNNNSNIQYSQMSVSSSGEIRVRIANTSTLTGVTFRGSLTFITA